MTMGKQNLNWKLFERLQKGTLLPGRKYVICSWRGSCLIQWLGEVTQEPKSICTLDLCPWTKPSSGWYQIPAIKNGKAIAFLCPGRAQGGLSP